MKEQILNLERTDDLHSLRDKILRTQANRLLIRWPALEQPLTRRLDLELMRRWARTVGADLAVISADPLVRKLTGQAGVPCFANLTEAALASISAQAKPPFQKAAPPGVRPRPAPPRTGSRIRFPLIIRLPLFLAAVLFPLGALGLAIPTAKIHASFPARTVSASIVLPASACEVLNLDIAVSERRMTTGSIRVPVTFAKGDVALANTTDRLLNIPAGIRFSSESGTSFLTTAGTILAPKGTGTVKVRAVEPGSGSNLAAGALHIVEGPLALFLTATNLQSLTGGLDLTRNAVAEEDLDLLRATLSEKVQAEGENGLLNLAGSTMTLAADSLQFHFDPADKPDFPVQTAVDTVGLTLHARATGLACPDELLFRQAWNVVLGNRQSGETLLADSIEVHLQMISSDQLLLKASGKAALIPAAQDVFSRLRLLAPAVAQTLLRDEFHATGPASIEIHPAWFPVLPLFPFRMELQPESG